MPQIRTVEQTFVLDEEQYGRLKAKRDGTDEDFWAVVDDIVGMGSWQECQARCVISWGEREIGVLAPKP